MLISLGFIIYVQVLVTNIKPGYMSVQFPHYYRELYFTKCTSINVITLINAVDYAIKNEIENILLGIIIYSKQANI